MLFACFSVRPADFVLRLTGESRRSLRACRPVVTLWLATPASRAGASNAICARLRAAAPDDCATACWSVAFRMQGATAPALPRTKSAFDLQRSSIQRRAAHRQSAARTPALQRRTGVFRPALSPLVAVSQLLPYSQIHARVRRAEARPQCHARFAIRPPRYIGPFFLRRAQHFDQRKRALAERDAACLRALAFRLFTCNVGRSLVLRLFLFYRGWSAAVVRREPVLR